MEIPTVQNISTHLCYNYASIKEGHSGNPSIGHTRMATTPNVHWSI